MKKIYDTPQTEVMQTRLEATFLDHFASTGGEEDDEFNSKKREDFEDEEDFLSEEINGQQGLW